MVAQHVLGKGDDLLVLGFLDDLLGRVDVDDARRIGDMGDLRIARLVGGLRKRQCADQAEGGERRNCFDMHDFSFAGNESRFCLSDTDWMQRRGERSRKSVNDYSWLVNFAA